MDLLGRKKLQTHSKPIITNRRRLKITSRRPKSVHTNRTTKKSRNSDAGSPEEVAVDSKDTTCELNSNKVEFISVQSIKTEVPEIEESVRVPDMVKLELLHQTCDIKNDIEESTSENCVPLLEVNLDIKDEPQEVSTSEIKDERIHHETTGYPCYYCNKVETTLEVLADHEKNVHILQKSYPCTVCFKVLKTHQSYKRHVRQHQPIANSCSSCSFKAPRPYILKQHIMKKHSNVNPLQYKCGECNKMFSTKVDGLDHEHTVHRKFVYKKCYSLKTRKLLMGNSCSLNPFLSMIQ